MKILRLFTVGLALFSMTSAFAGNQDRIGQAGGNQLLINPWARSSALANSNMSSVTGVEATFLNVAGLNFINKTEVGFVHTNYLSGSDITVNSFGLAQRVGESSTLGLTVMSMGFGDIDVTTVDLPEGGIGTYSPSIINLGLSYAKTFSNSIYGGLTLRTISESISDAGATGVSLDAGIRYITGEKEQIKFGIALKNVGPKMQHSGDGFSTSILMDEKEYTAEHRTEPYELPAQLNIGFSYDYYIGEQVDSVTNKITSDHRITGQFTFTSNSFGKDQLGTGVEYGFKDMVFARFGYLFDGIPALDDSPDMTAITGPTAGIGLDLPMGKGGSKIQLDYSYRFENPFGGSHMVGVRVGL